LDLITVSVRATSCALTGYSYDFIRTKSDTEKDTKIESTYGLMAQGLEKIMPNAVQTNENGVKFVNYSAVTPLLVEGLKEQQKRIEDLQQQISEFKKIIENK